MSILKNIFRKSKSLEFYINEKGYHFLGGKPPENFEVPHNHFKGNFQYIGFISKSDESFGWLPFDVNLLCPIYCDIDKIYLDYSYPNAPKLISPIDTEEVTSAFDELKEDSIIQFKKTNIALRKFEGINDENELEILGIADKPHFLQDHNIPVCPKNGKKMKFLCQFLTFGEIETEYTNVNCGNSGMQIYFDHLNFWCDGSLYVFIEPSTRTICYYIQNT